MQETFRVTRKPKSILHCRGPKSTEELERLTTEPAPIHLLVSAGILSSTVNRGRSASEPMAKPLLGGQYKQPRRFRAGTCDGMMPRVGEHDRAS
jgi:hypothetical protein